MAKKQLAHNLMTLIVTPSIHAHGYLMCPKKEEKEQVSALIEKIVDEVEKRHDGPLMMPMVLSTPLQPDGVEKVRTILRKTPEMGDMMDKATDRHYAAWFMHISNPDDAVLMELH